MASVTAPLDLALECRCGAVRGVATGVSPSAGNHAVCYCQDCQAFARVLERPDVLDASGGTDIFQMSQAELRFTAGVEHVACLRLTPRGLVRWYASCCNTPIGNTMASAGVPFIGVIRAFFGEPAGEALGPVRGRTFLKSATGDRAAIPRDGSPTFVMIARVLALMLRWRLRGDQRRSPLFDPVTGEPLRTPRVLTEAEREELRRRV